LNFIQLTLEPLPKVIFLINESLFVRISKRFLTPISVSRRHPLDIFFKKILY
jgi:hypothetical protein